MLSTISVIYLISLILILATHNVIYFKLSNKIDKLEKQINTNNKLKMINCTRCYWHDRCVCTFNSNICKLKQEPRYDCESSYQKKNIVYIGKQGERHNHLLCDHSRPFGFLKNGIQGFVDENNKFYNRHKAAKHAFECGQLIYDKTCPNIIVSEDLW